jgi:hypothetical protein
LTVLTRRRGIFFRFLLLLALAGCAGHRPPLPPAPHYATGPACYAALGAEDVVWAPAAAPGGSGRCGIADPLRVEATGNIAWDRPTVVACPLASALGAFTREVVQPSAQRLLGQRVAQLHHLGAWDCRKRTGSLFRMSEHASGRAIDLAAFELADGSRVSVKEDWDNGRRGRFLRAIATSACNYFSVVLTPETDRYHQDHLHLDVGPYRACN